MDRIFFLKIFFLMLACAFLPTLIWPMNTLDKEIYGTAKATSIERANELNTYIQQADIKKVQQFLKNLSDPNTEILTKRIPYALQGNNITTHSPLFYTIYHYINDEKNRSSYVNIIKMFLNVRTINLNNSKENDSILGYFFDDYGHKSSENSLAIDAKNAQIIKLIVQDPRFDVTSNDSNGNSVLSHLIKMKNKSYYALELLKIALRKPNLDVKKIKESVWEMLIYQIIFGERIELYPFVYKLLAPEKWFKDTESSVIFEVIGGLIPNQTINKVTAQAFLLSDKTKKSQSLNQLFLSNPDLLKTMKLSGEEKELYGPENNLLGKRLKTVWEIDMSQLELIKAAYNYAKKNNLKKIGRYINNYLYIRVNTPEDIGGIIAAFAQPEQLFQIPKSKVQTKRTFDNETDPEFLKTKKQK